MFLKEKTFKKSYILNFVEKNGLVVDKHNGCILDVSHLLLQSVILNFPRQSIYLSREKYLCSNEKSLFVFKGSANAVSDASGGRAGRRVRTGTKLELLAHTQGTVQSWTEGF